jgi:hypothetical protein
VLTSALVALAAVIATATPRVIAVLRADRRDLPAIMRAINDRCHSERDSLPIIAAEGPDHVGARMSRPS